MKLKIALLCSALGFAGCASTLPPRRSVASANPLYAHGHSFAVVRSEGGQITLSGSRCDPLESAATALHAWSGKGGTDFPCRCSPAGGHCEIDATNLVPDLVKANLARTALKPNCFNTALVGAGLMTNLEFTRFTVFEAALRAHCFRAPTPQPGDIGVVNLRGQGLSPIHAFIYLSPDFGFEKPGSDMQEPWRFMNPSELEPDYPQESSELFYYRCGKESAPS